MKTATTKEDTVNLADARSYFDGSTEQLYLDADYALEQIATADSPAIVDAIRTLHSYQATRRNIERHLGAKLNLSQTTALEALFNGRSDYGKVWYVLFTTHRRARRRAERALDAMIDAGALVFEPATGRLYVNPELVAELELGRPAETISTPTPKPLSPGSNRLRTSRVEAWIGRPHDTRLGSYWSEIDCGRFTSVKDAKRWADEIYPDAPVVNLTFFAAYNGWQSQAGPSRKNGAWSDEVSVEVAS